MPIFRTCEHLYSENLSLQSSHKLNQQRRAVAIAAVVLISLLVSGCASVGSGDKIVVRAEDVQVNSLSFYDTAMQWHFANSTKESPQLYKAFEIFRTKFPPAWKTLSTAIQTYKSGKTGDLAGALATVDELLANIRAVWTPPPPKAGG